MDRDNVPTNTSRTAGRKRHRQNRSQSSSASRSASASGSHSNGCPTNALPSNAGPSNAGPSDAVPSNFGPSDENFSLPRYSQVLQQIHSYPPPTQSSARLPPLRNVHDATPLPSMSQILAQGQGYGSNTQAPTTRLNPLRFQPGSMGHPPANQPSNVAPQNPEGPGLAQQIASSSGQREVAGASSQPRSRHASGRPLPKDARREAGASSSAAASGTQRSQCGVCGKTFSNVYSLQRHNRAEHQGIRYQCPECRREFAQQQTLDRHRSTQHSRNLFCPDCQRTFDNRRGLSQHRRIGCRHSFPPGGR